MKMGSANSNLDPQADAQEILQSVTQELATLQTRLSEQLNRDINYLQDVKEKLLGDLEILEEEYQDLRSRYDALEADYDAALSQQQLAQQQQWAKRLAQALATHLKGRLVESLQGELPTNGEGQPVSLANAYQLLSSLDATLNETLHTLQQDLNSYRSALSQQVSRMHSMEQQGEAILEALVTRLSQQLQVYTAREIPPEPGRSPLPAPSPRPMAAPPNPALRQFSRTAASPSLVPPRPAPPSEVAPPPTTLARWGWVLVGMAVGVLAFHNVVVAAIAYGGNLLGRFPMGDVFPLTLPNALLLVWLRMVVVLPLVVLVAAPLHGGVWPEVRQLWQGGERRPFYQVAVSSGFLLLSQILLYYAISDVGPGVAVTLLSLYPLVTLPLGWGVFGHRLTGLRSLVLVAIAMGFVLVALPHLTPMLGYEMASPRGILAAVGSGGCFALYLVSMKLSLRRFHPVAFGVVQFTALFAGSTALMGIAWLGRVSFQAPSSTPALLIGGLLLGILTFLSYVSHTLGSRWVGRGWAEMITASSPVVTAVLAVVSLPDGRSQLFLGQWVGILLVTLGLMTLGFERLTQPKRRRSQIKTSLGT